MRKQNLEFDNQRDLNEYLRRITGKKVNHFMSDIEIDIKDITEKSKELDNNSSITKVIGFRDSGVDGITYIKCRFSDKIMYAPKKEYKEIDLIRLEKKSNIVYYSVKRIFRNRFDTVERGLKANKYF